MSWLAKARPSRAFRPSFPQPPKTFSPENLSQISKSSLSGTYYIGGWTIFLRTGFQYYICRAPFLLACLQCRRLLSPYLSNQAHSDPLQKLPQVHCPATFELSKMTEYSARASYAHQIIRHDPPPTVRDPPTTDLDLKKLKDLEEDRLNEPIGIIGVGASSLYVALILQVLGHEV